jgi:hypothetical protein
MSYRVVWLPDAEAELTSIWLASSERDAVNAAASQLDALIRLKPTEVGESRSQGRRIIFVRPLAAIYRVILVTRVVEVVRVWQI